MGILFDLEIILCFVRPTIIEMHYAEIIDISSPKKRKFFPSSSGTLRHGHFYLNRIYRLVKVGSYILWKEPISVCNCYVEGKND